MSTGNDAMKEAVQPSQALPAEQAAPPRTPKGVVAILASADGRELANAANFSTAAPAGFSRRAFQERQVRRALALATMRALASPCLSDAIEVYTAEQILRTMCTQGFRIVVVPVGYSE